MSAQTIFELACFGASVLLLVGCAVAWGIEAYRESDLHRHRVYMKRRKRRYQRRG